MVVPERDASSERVKRQVGLLLALGKLMFDTGLAGAIGDAGVRLTGVDSLWGLTAAAIVIGVVLSETSSNTASASMVVLIWVGLRVLCPCSE